MKQDYQALWERIQQFELDDPAAAFPFSKKLAKEAEWPIAFARLAMIEYKKFLLLCCVSPRGASPSQVVDKVWHLHLTYTHNYWDELCSKVLHQQLHHHPSTGGTGEDKKHRDWYKETLRLYTEVFDEIPPSAIWPAPVESVESELSALASDYKNSTRIAPGIWLAVGGIIVIFGLIMQMWFGILNPYRLPGPLFLKWMFLLFLHSIGIAILLSSRQHGFRKLIHTSFRETYMHYGIIELLYGEIRALRTAILELVNHQLLEVTPSKKFINNVTDDVLLPTSNPLLPALARQAPAKKLHATNSNDELNYEDLKQLYHSHRTDTTESSKIKWLSAQKFKGRWVPYRFVLVILLFRLMQGLYHHQPVGYLLLGMLLFTIVYGFIIFCYSPAEMLKQVLRKKMEEDIVSQTNGAPADYVPGHYANSGASALAGLESYVLLANVFAIAPDNAKEAGSSVGVGSSCGSGGDGGGSCGGGGCGGCGGGGD